MTPFAVSGEGSLEPVLIGILAGVSVLFLLAYVTRVPYQRLVRELLAAQRATLLHLRSSGRIGDEAMRRVERDLDLEDTRLDLDRPVA